MSAIRKALIFEFGDVSKINIVRSTIEDPLSAHIQVKVLYSGFNGADISMRMGRYPMQKPAPLNPGYCSVGTVAKKGPDCTSNFSIGDLVACMTVYDSEAGLCNQREKYHVPVPRGLDLQQACARRQPPYLPR
ncbi:hypothetical protein LTR37_015119 [Vermiconidia calcicola]|uniref:Uncharacterized protein n=1 Tax=Vermiconidia calcicola TaxID=1690605 RepID=A0ACC3MT85_9PEZI|nr:hypothetical protein LTR37_015119 [Vermiconidia calcicola]